MLGSVQGVVVQTSRSASRQRPHPGPLPKRQSGDTKRKPHEHARIGHFAIALADFAGTQGRAALGPPPDDFVALVEQAAVEEVFQRPPHAFDVALMEGDVGLVEVNPEAEPLGQLLPLLGVAEDAFDALADERLDAVGLDFLLGMDAQFLADLDLDGQTVRIPAGLALAEVSAHGLIAGKKILDRPGQAVARMGQSIGRGRAFVEDERRAPALGRPAIFRKSPALSRIG